MPWTVDDPPNVAKNWSDEEIAKCVAAANAVLADGGTDEDAIFACIHAADRNEAIGRSERAMKIERRSFPVELRAEMADGGPQAIVGHAAVFNTLSEDLGGFREIVAPGAFKKTLQEADVRALFNHDPNYVLGRTRAGTLALAEDETGLAIQAMPPDTQWARDLAVSLERGDIDEMSFGFRAIKDHWEGQVRTLLEVQLFDVSVVTFPAYPDAEAHLRSLMEAVRETEARLGPDDPREDRGTDEPAQEGHSDEIEGENKEPGQEAHSVDLANRRRTLELIQKTL